MIAEWGSWMAKIRRKKIFLTLHGGKLNEFEKTNPNRVNMVLNRADRILTPSLFLQSYFKEKGYKVDYIPNPLSLEKFPFKLGRNIDDNYKILWVRAFGEIYQPDLAIRTLYEIKKKIPFATLTMIGPDKGLMNESKLLVDSLGLTKDVQFIGPVPNDSLFNYYQSHHCYLNTPKYESFGVALMEAASCGIPIVSLGVGEITYLWKHEYTMRIVFEHEAKKLASEIAILANNAVLAESQALNAKNIAEQFEWKHLRSKWLDLIQ
jgi:glycosyltransferase involved in cell wall biosynthesis